MVNYYFYTFYQLFLNYTINKNERVSQFLIVFVLQYLGSMLVKELRGTESTHDACAKMRVRVVSPCLVILLLPSGHYNTVIEKTGLREHTAYLGFTFTQDDI